MHILRTFLRGEGGQDLVEYGLLAGLLSIVAVGVLTALGPLVNNLYVLVQNVLP